MKTKILEKAIEKKSGFRKWEIEGMTIICEACHGKIIWRISDCYGTVYPSKGFLRILFAGYFNVENGNE